MALPSRFAILSAFIILFSSLFQLAAAQDKDFNQKGYPTIAVIGSAVLIVVTIFAGIRSGGNFASLVSHLVFTILNLFLLFAGIVLIFGPDGGGVRAEIIGLQLVLQVCIGLFIALTSNIFFVKLYSIFGIFNILCLMGSLAYLSYSAPIWYLSTTICDGYFLELDINRCKTDGYLQFLRVIGTIALLVNFVAVALTTLDWLAPDALVGSGTGVAAATTTQTKTMTGPTYENPNVINVGPAQPVVHHHQQV